MATTGTQTNLGTVTPILASSAGFTRIPSGQTWGNSCVVSNRITCERCHIAQAGDDALSNDHVYNEGHEFGSVTGSLATPTLPSGTYANSLCLECHHQEIQNTTAVGVYAANTVVPQYPPLAFDGGTCCKPGVYDLRYLRRACNLELPAD